MASRKSQSSLSESLAERRRVPNKESAAARAQEPWEMLKQRAQPALAPANHYKTAEMMGNDIAVALAAEIEELNTYHHGFRSALHRVFSKVLRIACEKTERVVLFHEAVPGYTLMLFKKDKWSPEDITSTENTEPVGLDHSAEGRAASVLIGEHVQRTGKRVIVIEHVDSLFLFFPAEDLRKNVRDLGYFGIE